MLVKLGSSSPNRNENLKKKLSCHHPETTWYLFRYHISTLKIPPMEPKASPRWLRLRWCWCLKKSERMDPRHQWWHRKHIHVTTLWFWGFWGFSSSFSRKIHHPSRPVSLPQYHRVFFKRLAFEQSWNRTAVEFASKACKHHTDENDQTKWMRTQQAQHKHETQRCDSTQLPEYLWKISNGNPFEITRLIKKDNYMGYSWIFKLRRRPVGVTNKSYTIW